MSYSLTNHLLRPPLSRVPCFSLSRLSSLPPCMRRVPSDTSRPSDNRPRLQTRLQGQNAQARSSLRTASLSSGPAAGQRAARTPSRNQNPARHRPHPSPAQLRVRDCLGSHVGARMSLERTLPDGGCSSWCLGDRVGQSRSLSCIRIASCFKSNGPVRQCVYATHPPLFSV